MAGYPYGLSEHLSADDRAHLEAVQVPLGAGRVRTVADLVVGYGAHVNKLLAERDLQPSEDRDAWNAHDYVATLILRGLADRGLGLLDDDLRAKVNQAVARVDELLKDFTEPDQQHLVRRFAAEDAGPQWWWDRIPRSGPVRAELLGFAERPGAP
jgi:hypothetical protein